MRDHTEEQLRLLLSHVDDLCRRAAGGAIGSTAFLTMREQIEIDRHIGSAGKRSTVFWGGYMGSERKMLFCLLAYLVGERRIKPSRQKFFSRLYHFTVVAVGGAF